MDDYHVDNEIAKGEAGSVVYRGRKKRSLEFVAVKSVDKGQVAKVSCAAWHQEGAEGGRKGSGWWLRGH